MSIRLVDGKWLIVDGQLATDDNCCCAPPCSGACDEENPCPEGCCCCDGECAADVICDSPSVFIDGVWIGGSGWVLPFGFWPKLPEFFNFMPIDLGEGCLDIDLPPTGFGTLFMGGGYGPPESGYGVGRNDPCGLWTIYFGVEPLVDAGAGGIGSRGAMVFFRTVWEGCRLDPETGRFSLTFVSSEIEVAGESGICGPDNQEAFDPSVDWTVLNGSIEIGCGCGTPCPDPDPEVFLDPAQYYFCVLGCECVDEVCVEEGEAP